MKVEFEQVFYGCGERGYGVLGASPGGRRFAGRVEALCGGVGTPDGEYGGEPFLLSVPDGEWVVMVCGRRGAPDSVGRRTLFFHALAGRREELDAAGADAFALFGRGAFAARMPEGGLERLSIEFGTGRRGGGGAADRLPAVIRAGGPAGEAVRALAGGRANELRWATYAFQAMAGFDIQAVPRGTALPRGANEYDGEGRLLRAWEGGGDAKKTTPTGAERADGRAPDGDAGWRGGTGTFAGGGGAAAGKGKGGGGGLALSVLCNVALAAACVFLLARRPSGDGEGNGDADAAEQRAAIGRAAVERYRAELAARFPAGARIGDFDQEATEVKVPKWAAIQANEFPTAKAFFERIKTYVDFVNRDILNDTDTKEHIP